MSHKNFGQVDKGKCKSGVFPSTGLQWRVLTEMKGSDKHALFGQLIINLTCQLLGMFAAIHRRRRNAAAPTLTLLHQQLRGRGNGHVHRANHTFATSALQMSCFHQLNWEKKHFKWTYKLWSKSRDGSTTYCQFQELCWGESGDLYGNTAAESAAAACQACIIFSVPSVCSELFLTLPLQPGTHWWPGSVEGGAGSWFVVAFMQRQTTTSSGELLSHTAPLKWLF